MQLMDDEYRILLKLIRKDVDDLDQLAAEEQRRVRLLSDAGYVSLSERHKFIAGVTALGHHAMSAYRQERREKARARVRYWITTAIALAALVKSFLPEIRGLLALILKRPAQ